MTSGLRPTYAPSIHTSAPLGSVVTYKEPVGTAARRSAQATTAARRRSISREPWSVMSGDLAPSLRWRPATVAVVGRPNVGKSALFNRLLGQRLAIVEDTPGVTRDRLYALAEWRNRTFTLVDTGGIDTDVDPSDAIAAGTQAQAEAAARDADVIVLVVDAQDGLTPVDQEVAQILRRTRRPVILVANKIESPKHAASVHA